MHFCKIWPAPLQPARARVAARWRTSSVQRSWTASPCWSTWPWRWWSGWWRAECSFFSSMRITLCSRESGSCLCSWWSESNYCQTLFEVCTETGVTKSGWHAKFVKKKCHMCQAIHEVWTECCQILQIFQTNIRFLFTKEFTVAFLSLVFCRTQICQIQINCMEYEVQ